MLPQQPAVPEPATIKAAVNRVDGLVGSIRYDGKKVVGVQADKNPASDENVKVFAGLTDLEELVLRGEAVTDAAVGYLAGLPKLYHLSLDGTSITDDGVAKMKQLRGLQRLSLSRATSMTDGAMAHLAALPDLQYLELRDNNIGDAALDHLKRLNNIRLLDVRGCKRVTDAGLAHLTGLTGLVALRLRSPAIRQRRPRQACRHGQAHGAIRRGTGGSDRRRAQSARELPRDDHLECPIARALATAASRRGRHAKASATLSARHANYRACLGYVKDGANLRRIDLNETRADNDALTHLRGMRHLQWLSLRKTRVTDAGMQRLAGLPKLTYLQLAETAVGDTGLAEIAKIESSRRTGLGTAADQRQGAGSTEESQNLKRLNIAMVTVSDEAVAAYRRPSGGWRFCGGGFPGACPEKGRRNGQQQWFSVDRRELVEGIMGRQRILMAAI